MENTKVETVTEIKVDKKLLDAIDKFEKLWKLTYRSAYQIDVYLPQLGEHSEYIVEQIRKQIGREPLY